MLFSSLSAVLALSYAATGYSAPTTSHVLHEKRNDSPQTPWKRHSRAQGHEVLPMRIGLKQRNLEHAERYIDDIANPSSPNFGKHWSAEKVAEVFAPEKDTSNGVMNWLTTSGIDAKRLKYSTGRCHRPYLSSHLVPMCVDALSPKPASVWWNLDHREAARYEPGSNPFRYQSISSPWRMSREVYCESCR
jgi:hypothetical protein